MSIKLQILLHPARRTPDAVATIAGKVRSLGLRVTASGTATLSAMLDEADLAKIFGVDAAAAYAIAKSGSDENVALPVPAGLVDDVASITLPAKHLYLPD